MIPFLSLLLLLGCAKASSVTGENCGDVLSEFGAKPTQLEFLDCKTVDAPQVALEARYRVPGPQAEVVEKFLRENYGMNDLQFVCCGWEPKEGHRGNLQVSGRYFSIGMHSDETLIGDRAKWGEIPFFYVVVEELVNF